MKIVNDEQGIVNDDARMIVRACLQRPIAFHRIFARIGGGATAGLFLSQLFYWSEVMEDSAYNKGEEFDGWFYKTQAQWEEETALTRREQETARRNLKARGLIKEKERGMPSKLHFRLEWPALLAAIQKYLSENPLYGGKRHTSMAESAKQVRPKAPNMYGGKRHSTQSTRETTQKTTTSSDVDVSQKTSSSVEFDDQEYHEWSERLKMLRVTPGRIDYLLERYAERVIIAVPWWEQNKDYWNDRDKPGGAVAKSITHPHTCPQAYEQPEAKEEAAPQKPRESKAEKRERLRPVYEKVWNGIKPPLREMLEREGKDMFEYVENSCPNELAQATREYS